MRKGFADKMIGFLLGGVIGVAVGFLTAPRSGVKTRSMINEKGKDTLDQMVGRYQETRDQAEDMVSDVNHEITNRSNKLKKVGRKMMDRERKVVHQGVREAKRAVSA